jgi:hypothetical protein
MLHLSYELIPRLHIRIPHTRIPRPSHTILCPLQADELAKITTSKAISAASRKSGVRAKLDPLSASRARDAICKVLASSDIAIRHV